jgi:hypothetical protein
MRKMPRRERPQRRCKGLGTTGQLIVAGSIARAAVVASFLSDAARQFSKERRGGITARLVSGTSANLPLSFRALTMRGVSDAGSGSASGCSTAFMARLLGMVTMRVGSAGYAFFFRTRFRRWA